MGSSRSRGSPRNYEKKFNPNTYKTLDEFKETDSGFYTEINEKMDELLQNYNSRDIEQIKTHLETIKKKLDAEIDGSVDLLYGGSIKKYTYVEGLSDIDMLVILNRTELLNKKPEEILNYLVEKLKERLPKTDITIGNLAITVKFSSDIEIQLLPSIKTKTGFRIMNPETKNWSNVLKPDKFATNLTEVNKKNNGKVIPMIKLFKQINEKTPKTPKMSGYHIEALAIDIFKDYIGPKTHSKMLLHFCQNAQKRVLTPMGEITGQSEYLDSKLGDVNSINRKKLSSYLERLSRKMEHAISTSSIDKWVQLFE